ncbi:MAG TPA: outer membrane lipoprotein-sorting protein [Polyangiaceae bacterium]|jgi:outer membrane lipoprotein-sorting protein
MRVNRRGFLGQAGALAAAVVLGSRPALAEAPEEILRKADDVRNPADSYFLRCVIKSSGTDEETEIEASVQGNTRTLVKTLRPARDKGRLGLMVDQDMWAYVPNLHRAVRVTLSQRLVGQAANGDICRNRWSGDYTPVIEAETPHDWALLLTANKRGLTYEKIRLWVEKQSFHPLRAEFLTPQGKPLKRAEYRAYKPMSGKDRPTVLHIEDALRASDFSDVQIVEATPRQFPASIFYAENLK